MTRTSIGILGAGQLGRMLAISGAQLGFKIELLHDEDSPCAGEVASYQKASLSDEQTIKAFAAKHSVTTAEFENVPLSVLSWASESGKLFPPPPAFAVAQDRLLEKELAQKLGIKTPRFAPVSSLAELESAFASLGAGKFVLKTRSLGYDGKGQARINAASEIAAAWTSIGERPAILEEFFPFESEVSCIVARSTRGEIKAYDLCQNTHQSGILVKTSVEPNHPLQLAAVAVVEKVLSKLNYSGVLTVEFFVKNGELYFNELAPRVHNSGHWTIEGAETSQFENHLRAILGLPLGSTKIRGNKVEMLNILGTAPKLEEVLKEENLHLHLYGKEERPGRKIGHLTKIYW